MVKAYATVQIHLQIVQHIHPFVLARGLHRRHKLRSTRIGKRYLEGRENRHSPYTLQGLQRSLQKHSKKFYHTRQI